MTSRERVLAVFNRQIPDRVPVWCGASPEFMEKARKHLGVSDDEAVYQRFRDDFRRVYSRYAGPEKFDPVLNAANGTRRNVFGVERIGEGYGVPANTPLKDATLEDVENYPWPSPDWIDVSHIREDALQYGGEYAIMGGEWCPFFHDLLDLLGMEDALVMMYEEPEVVHAVLNHLVDYYYPSHSGAGQGHAAGEPEREIRGENFVLRRRGHPGPAAQRYAGAGAGGGPPSAGAVPHGPDHFAQP